MKVACFLHFMEVFLNSNSSVNSESEEAVCTFESTMKDPWSHCHCERYVAIHCLSTKGMAGRSEPKPRERRAGGRPPFLGFNAARGVEEDENQLRTRRSMFPLKNQIDSLPTLVWFIQSLNGKCYIFDKEKNR